MNMIAFMTIILLPLAGLNANGGFEQFTPETPLAQAICHGDIEQFSHHIIQNPEAINEVDSRGRTPLMWAGICNSRRTGELLLNAGADVHLADHNGETALHFAGRTTYEHDPPCMETKSPDVELVLLLLEAGSNVNAGNGPYGTTPLHGALASYDPSVEIVEILLNAGANPNSLENGIWAPVNIVANYENHMSSAKRVELMTLLVNAGADPNHPHFFAGPPIVQAIDHRDEMMERCLLSLGADPVDPTSWYNGD